MKINAQAKKQAPTQQVVNMTGGFEVVLATKELSGNKVYIPSIYTPKAIIWYNQSGDAFYDSNPHYEEATGDLYGGRYYTTDHFTTGDKAGFIPTQVYYIPSEEYSASRLIQELNVPITTTTNTTAMFDYLNLKLENISKQTSQWDALNIYKVVYSRDDFSEGLSSLPLNSSMIVNVDDITLKLGDKSLDKGDIIIKDKDGVLHVVKGAKGGFYYPSKIEMIEGGSTLASISFRYTQYTPQDDNKTVEEGDSIDSAYQTITFELNGEAANSNSGYGMQGELNPSQTENLDYISTEDGYLEPIIYYYLIEEDGGNVERIIFPEDFLNVTVEENGGSINKIQIKNPSSVKVAYEVR